ncbi:uncharacterized protein LOC143908781 isoform X2 [Temnothorax americanus]|uniref:uncharacterized protein LOC143908781 isoform X2 n=1 Tax=Temnothorax americanus TaxID=1964332 RepID=UPI00406965E2
MWCHCISTKYCFLYRTKYSNDHRMTEKTCYAVVEFMDGLQVIPTNCRLSQDLQSALWPNFTNNKSYDKAIKQMIDPESTWASHSIKKIFGTFVSYVRAMKKLKEAEDTSDLNSGTEKEEFLKKSRKVRAAKPIDSSNDEEEESDDSFVSELPTFPKKRCHEITQCMSKNKVGRPRKDNANKENNDQNVASYDITKKNSRNNYNANKEKSVQNIASYTTKKKIKKSVKLIADKLSIDIIDKKTGKHGYDKRFSIEKSNRIGYFRR